MEINWQNVFYFTASLAMIVTFIVSVWFMWLLYVATGFIKNFKSLSYRWEHTMDNVRYFKKNIILKFLGYILQILDKKSHNE